MAAKGHILVDRQLSTGERTLLEWLLLHGGPDSSKYKSQIDGLHVVSRCGCGCPTVDFALQSGRKVGASEIVAEAGGKSPEGISVGVILHVWDGELSEPEVYSTQGLDVPFSLPLPESLEHFDIE
jgi:hypothetical protein